MSHTKNATVTVNAPEHSSAYRKSADGTILHLHRRHHRSTPVTLSDVWGSWWTMAVGNVPKGAVKFRHGSLEVPLEGGGVVFIPAFGLVEWHVGTVPFEFNVIYGTGPLPLAPQTPCLFRTGVLPDMPDTVDEVSALLSSLQDPVDISCVPDPRPMAEAVKQYIDRTFRQNLHLQEIARELGYSHSVMTRNFKASYLISPVEYRTRLRVNDSIPSMLLKKLSVSEAAQSVGFADVSRFQKNFRDLREATPSTFRF